MGSFVDVLGVIDFRYSADIPAYIWKNDFLSGRTAQIKIRA